MENGKVAIVPELIRHCGYGSTEFHVLRPRDGIDAKWAAYFISQVGFRRDARRNMTGSAGQLRVPKPWIKHQQVPVAPTNEQRRIVAKIEELFSDLDAGVAALERAKANLKRYRAAVLKAAVEGKLTEQWRTEHPNVEPADKLLERILIERRRRWEEDQLAKYKAKDKKPPTGWKDKYKEPAEPDTTDLPSLPDGWCWATADQLTDETRAITYGVVKLGAPTDGGVPTLRSSNVRSLHLDLDYVKPISQGIAKKYTRTMLTGGELLVTVRGTLGGIAVVPPTCLGFNISREVAMLALVEPSLGPALAISIASRTTQNWIMRRTRGIAYTGINIQTLKEMPLPLGPAEELEQIVVVAEELISITNQSKQDIERSESRVKRLRQSILKRAFEGNLVPQDSSDEPADKLLERIRTNLQSSQRKKTATNKSRTPTRHRSKAK
jgi:type I restriction enzyme S subunit